MSDTLRRSLPRIAGFAALYLVATYAGRLTVMDSTDLSLVWPAAGVLSVWAVAARRSRWWWVDALCLVAITLVVNRVTGASYLLSGWFAVANLTQAAAFTFMMDRWLPAARRPLTTLNDLWRFMGAAVLSTVAGAGIGSAGLWESNGTYTAGTAVIWLARNLVSVMVVGVGLWRIGHLIGLARRPRTSRKPGAPLYEYVLITAVSLVAYGFTFALADGAPITFVTMAISIWAGLRLSTTYVALHTLTFGTVVMLFTLTGSGPFASIASHTERALVAQLFVGTVAIVGLALALGRDERTTLVTRLRDSERAAVDHARTLDVIVDSLLEGLAVVDEHGHFVLRNAAAPQILGVRSPNGMIGDTKFYGMFNPDGTPMADQRPLHLQILEGSSHQWDVLLRNEAIPEGRLVHVSGTEIPAGDNGLRRVLIVFDDVTAERRHRDELAAFAGVVAHDLLNPLTTIEGWSENLAGELDEGFAANSVTRIQRAASRMRSLINGLLAYTTARDATLSPTAVDLGFLVRDIATSRLDQAQSVGAPMPRFDIGELAEVDADPILTRQLLENLIGNAIKYTAPGVIPRIAVHTTTTDDGFVRIAVDDNGIGIPDGQQEAIFKNFHRAHASSAYAGTGLGLAICKRIVERHGGTISVTGNEGGGSSMTFTLPMLRRTS